MAELLDTYLPFDDGPGANAAESEWRDMMKHMLGSNSGVIRGFDNNFNTFGDSTGMQVKVDTGQCWMRGHFGKSTSIKTLTVAANASGNDRIDRVILRNDFTDNEIELDVLTGTPSATPTAPAVTQNASVWETSLATVAVDNGAVTIASGDVTDARVFTTAYAKYTRTTQQTITANTTTFITFNQVDIGAGDIVGNSASPSSFTLNRSGLWQITAQIGWGAPATSVGQRLAQITDNTGTILYGQVAGQGVSGFECLQQVQANERFSSGQVIRFQVRHSHNTSLGTTADNTKIMIMWVGP